MNNPHFRLLMYCVLTKCHSNVPAFTLFTYRKYFFTELIQLEAWEELLGMFFFKFWNLSSTQILREIDFGYILTVLLLTLTTFKQSPVLSLLANLLPGGGRLCKRSPASSLLANLLPGGGWLCR